MQATINYTFAQPTAKKADPAKAIIRKEVTQKILLFAGILSCLILAVNI